MSRHWNPSQNAAVKELGGNEKFSQLAIETKILRSRLEPPKHAAEPIAQSLNLTSTYKIPSVQQFKDMLLEGGNIYSRIGNPNSDAVELVINELEGGAGTILFSSGMAAICTTYHCFLKSGDHLICQRPSFTASQCYADYILPRNGIEVDWVMAGSSVDEYRKLIKPNTKMMFGETPCNPDMSILDLEEFGRLGMEHPNIITVIDGTLAGPILQKPLRYGINISIHSCTKYMNGHGDLLAGCATVSNIQLWKELKWFQGMNGSCNNPFDSYMLLRGLKTLPARMEKHCNNAKELAKFLEQNPKVKHVWYPGNKSHPGHERAMKQMSDFGGMISFDMGTLESAKALVENVKIINLAVSLGSVESLIEHPASMTRGSLLMTDEQRKRDRITPGLIRFSVGLENVADLKADLEQALEKA